MSPWHSSNYKMCIVFFCVFIYLCESVICPCCSLGIACVITLATQAEIIGVEDMIISMPMSIFLLCTASIYVVLASSDHLHLVYMA